jgi:hypothetical protein
VRIAELGTLAPTGLYIRGATYMVIKCELGVVIRMKKVRTVIYESSFASDFIRANSYVVSNMSILSFMLLILLG